MIKLTGLYVIKIIYITLIYEPFQNQFYSLINKGFTIIFQDQKLD